MVFAPGFNKKSTNHFIRKVVIFILLFLQSFLYSKAQQVTEIITDFGGYWRTTAAANNSILPNDSHNLLAFNVGGTIYSTGANNTVLTSNAVSFTNGNFKCLPITSVTGSITTVACAIGLAINYDGVPNGFSSPLPAVKMKDVLTDGINGLDLGTGVIDIPASAKLTFPIQSIDANSITDAKPDILFTQIASPDPSKTDTMYFVNSAGLVVGNKVVVTWSSVQAVGNYYVDFYNLQQNVQCDQAVITGGLAANNNRPLRLTAFKLSDFGITVSNKALVASLILQPCGKSDVGFVAYNSDAFVIAPPTITSQPQTKVVCAGAGSSATFSVTATGTNDTYQWMKNGANIAGATSSSYTVSPVTSNDAGYYEVVITNSGGAVTSNRAYLNTAITRQPSPSSQTIVTGNTVTLSVSATNASSFQWKKNGVDIAGATDSIYTISPLNTTDSGAYTVSAINSTNSCATVLSNPASITPAIVVYSKSTPDINIPSTWGANTDGSGSTPVDFTRAEHTFVLSNRASGNTLTDLTIAGTLDVKNGIAIIANNTTLDVGWCIRTGTGSLTGSTSSGFTVRGNSNLYFTSGSQFLKNFTITAGTINMLTDLTISGASLPGKLNLTGGTLALNGNKITISSSSNTNTSMVTAVGATASITYGNGGAFIIERYIPPKRAFRLISPAVTTTKSIKSNWMEGATNPDRWTNNNPLPGYGTHITGSKTAADSLDATQTYNPSLFTFDYGTLAWKPVANSFSTLNAGSAYRLMVRGSRSVDLNNNEATPSATIIRTTGSLLYGSKTIPSSALNAKVDGYSFVGNPYACPVDWSAINKTGITSAYYSWDETINTRGAYVSFNSSSNTNGNPASLVDKNIQSQQAFFIQSSSTSPSLTFNESNKSYTNTSVFRSTNDMTKLSVQLLLNLNGGSNNTADGFVAVYDNKFSPAVGDEDATKITNLDENMAIYRNGKYLSIEGRPTIIGNDSLPMKTWQFRQKNYWLKIDASNFSPDIYGFLKDNYLQQETPLDLASSTTIPFTINADSASFNSNRFSIIFETFATLPVEFTNLKVTQQKEGNLVDWNTATEQNVAHYEVEKSLTGNAFATVFTVKAKNDGTPNHNYNWFDDNKASENVYYRIKIVEINGGIRYSHIVRVNNKERISSLTVFPNPSNGLSITFILSGVNKGRYAIKITNSAGQKVFAGSTQFDGTTLKETLSLAHKLKKGNYIVELTNGEVSLHQAVLVN